MPIGPRDDSSRSGTSSETVMMRWLAPKRIRLGLVSQSGVALSQEGIGAAAIGGDTVDTKRLAIHLAVQWKVDSRWFAGLWLEAFDGSVKIPATDTDDLLKRFPRFEALIERPSDVLEDRSPRAQRRVDDAVDDLRDERLTDDAHINYSGVSIGMLFSFTGVDVARFAPLPGLQGGWRVFSVDLGVHGSFVRGSLDVGERGRDSFAGEGGGVRLGFGSSLAFGPVHLGAQWAIHVDVLMQDKEFIAATFNHGAFIYVGLDPTELKAFGTMLLGKR